MAGAAAAANDQNIDASKSPVNSTAIVLLNKKLRAGFGLFVIAPAQPSAAPLPVGKGTPAAVKPSAAQKPSPAKTPGEEIGSILGGGGAQLPTSSGAAIPAAPKAKSLAPRDPAAIIIEELRLAEEKKRKEEEEEKRRKEEEARRAEEAKKKAEELRLAEEKKREEEQKQREKERLETQEKLRLEKLRIEEERIKAREERRQKLSLIERDRRENLSYDGKTGKETNTKSTLSQVYRPAQTPVGDDLAVCLRLLTSKLKAKKTQYEKNLLEFPGQTKPLEQKKLVLRSEIDRINAEELATVSKNEQEIESKEAAEKTKLTENMGAQLEKAIEQKLWAIEDQRKEIEKQRWAIEDQIDKILAEIEVIEDQVDQKTKNEDLVRQKIKDVANQEKMVSFCLEKSKLEEEILKSINQRDAISPVLDAAEKRKFAAKERFQELSEKETNIKAELETIEHQEKQETDTAKKRAIEQARWKANSSLKNAVQTKWEAEEKLKTVANEAQILQTKIDTINEKINHTQADIAAKETGLEGEGLPIRKMRDAISRLFAENELEVDHEILKDIVQDDELPETERPAKTTPLKAAEIPETVTAHTTTTLPIQNQIAETSTPLQAPALRAETGAPVSIPISSLAKNTDKLPAQPVAVPAAGPTSAEKPAVVLNPAQALPKTAVETSPEIKTQTAPAILTTEIKIDTPIPPAPVKDIPVNKTESATTPVKPAIKEVEVIAAAPTIKGTKEPAAVIAPAEIKPVAPKTEALPVESVKKTELAVTKETLIKKEPTVTATPAAGPTSAEKPAADAKKENPNKVFSPYREQISIPPATNIRQFIPKNIPEKTSPEKTQETEVKPSNELENRFPKTEIAPVENGALATKDPGKDIWEDRWGQIKKNTTPAATAAVAAAGGEAISEPQIIEKPTGNKMIVRIMVILLLLAIISVILVLVLSKNKDTMTKTDTTTPAQTDTTKKTDPKSDDPTAGEGNGEKLTTLATISTIPIITEDLASVPNLILPYTKTTLDQSGYSKITIQNKKDNTYVGLKQFLNIYKVTGVPSGFYSSISDDFVLFIYSNKTKNRLGFVTEVGDEQALNKAMTSWENKLVADTNNFYNLIGRKTQENPEALVFKSNTAANGTTYRSLTFSPASDAYTISYAIYNSKWLIFTTSEESLIKIFDQLPK